MTASTLDVGLCPRRAKHVAATRETAPLDEVAAAILVLVVIGTVAIARRDIRSAELHPRQEDGEDGASS